MKRSTVGCVVVGLCLLPEATRSQIINTALQACLSRANYIAERRANKIQDVLQAVQKSIPKPNPRLRNNELVYGILRESSVVHNSKP